MKTNGLVAEAAKLPRNPDRAVAFPMGSSTFRALMIDRQDRVLDEFEMKHPHHEHESVTHAIAGALVRFGCRPAVGAAFIAGSVPFRGPLQFTNIKEWEPFDRDETDKYFGFKTEWMQDGTAGYYGLARLNSNDFATLRQGEYQRGDRYIYAILGTGANVGCPLNREDGHNLFVPKSDEDRDFQLWFKERFGHWPEIEDVVSGGDGMRNVAEFFIEKHKLKATDPFVKELEATHVMKRAEVVTTYALKGHSTAETAMKLSFGAFGGWVGQMAITHQVTRIDLSPGILSIPELREYVLEKTGFLAAIEDQGRPMFVEHVKKCTLRVCLRNPESEGAVERAAGLLRETT
jgi:glucokinase